MSPDRLNCHLTVFMRLCCCSANSFLHLCLCQSPPRCCVNRYQVSFLLIDEYSLTVPTVEIEPSELPPPVVDSYEGIDWESFNDMTSATATPVMKVLSKPLRRSA